MVHSKLPVLPLLCLLWAVLMPGVLSKAPSTDPGVQKALAFAVEQYNQEENKSSNYFKHLGLLKARKEAVNGIDYHLTVRMVITRCKKKIGETLTYEKIQQCTELLGNKKKKICYFKVTAQPPSNEMKLVVINCKTVRPKDPLMASQRILRVSSSRAISGVRAVFTASFANSDTNEEGSGSLKPKIHIF